jgi:hypothetical protein
MVGWLLGEEMLTIDFWRVKGARIKTVALWWKRRRGRGQQPRQNKEKANRSTIGRLAGRMERNLLLELNSLYFCFGSV